MKDFKHFGIKRRFFPENNYNAFWYNLKQHVSEKALHQNLNLIKQNFMT